MACANWSAGNFVQVLTDEQAETPASGKRFLECRDELCQLGRTTDESSLCGLDRELAFRHPVEDRILSEDRVV